MVRSKFSIAVLTVASAGVGLGATSASARTTDGALNIGLRVVKACDFAVGRMDFGQPGFLTPTIDQTAPVIVVCTPNTPFTVTLDAGQNFSGGSRQMKRITGIFPPALPYTLYTDAARSNLWGVNQALPGNSGPSGKTTVPIYGRVTGLTLSLGSYSDDVVVTFTF